MGSKIVFEIRRVRQSIGDLRETVEAVVIVRGRPPGSRKDRGLLLEFVLEAAADDITQLKDRLVRNTVKDVVADLPSSDELFILQYA